MGVHGSSEESVARAMAKLAGRAPGARMIAAPGDFSAPGAVDAMVAKLVQEAGKLDAVIHCAILGAEGAGGVFAQTDPNAFALHAARVMGVFQQLCFSALPHLKQQGGAIVAIVSDAGRFAAPRQSVIGGAFAGIIGFVRSLALETSRDRVRVNCISLSFVENTPIFERFSQLAGRAGASAARAGLGLPSPQDIAPLALFLCGPDFSEADGPGDQHQWRLKRLDAEPQASRHARARRAEFDASRQVADRHHPYGKTFHLEVGEDFVPVDIGGGFSGNLFPKRDCLLARAHA